MNKLTRKLLVSVFTLAFALVTLGATTFAWFTLQSTASVDTINLNTSTGFGIEISADGETWKNSVTVAELMANNPAFSTLNAITTPNGKNFVDLQNEEVTTGFIEFKLQFRSTTSGIPVYLDSTTYTSSTGRPWTPDVDFNYRGGTVANPVTVYSADSLRMSFEEYPTNAFLEPAEGESSYPITVWELDPTITSRSGANMRLDNAVNETSGLFAYWEAKGLDLDFADHTLPTTVYHNKAVGSHLGTSGQPILTLSTDKVGDYAYGYIKVRLWLEGWDPDNFDSLFNNPLTVNLNFAVAAQEGQ